MSFKTIDYETAAIYIREASIEEIKNMLIGIIYYAEDIKEIEKYLNKLVFVCIDSETRSKALTVLMLMAGELWMQLDDGLWESYQVHISDMLTEIRKTYDQIEFKRYNNV